MLLDQSDLTQTKGQKMVHSYGAVAGEVEMGSAPAQAGGLNISGRRVAGAILVLTCCTLALGYHMAGEEGVGDFGLLTKPPKSEGKVVDAAEDATIDYASHDVTAAALKAQKEARENYQKMMSSALKAEAQAHKNGEKATARSMIEEDKRERRKMELQQNRAMRYGPLLSFSCTEIRDQHLFLHSNAAPSRE